MLHFTCSRIVHRIVPWSLSQSNAKFRIYDIWKLPPKGKMCVIHSGDFSWLTSAGLKVSSPILSLGINLVEASKMGMNFYWCCIKNLNRRGCMKWFIKNDCRFFLQFLHFSWSLVDVPKKSNDWVDFGLIWNAFSSRLRLASIERPLKFDEVLISSGFSSIVSNVCPPLFLLKPQKARVTFLNWLLFELNSMALMELMNQSR